MVVALVVHPEPAAPRVKGQGVDTGDAFRSAASLAPPGLPARIDPQEYARSCARLLSVGTQ
jgi:hypothetical protein